MVERMNVTGEAVKAREENSHHAELKVAAVVRTLSRYKPMWVGAILLAATIFTIYFPAIHGRFLWDDDAHVTRPELRSLYGLYRIWFDLRATQQYYPLLHSAFWAQHKLWGDASVAYHLANILLHGLAAWLVLLVLRRLKIPGAWMAAAIFALHPVQVESVAWITEQKNTLSTVFYLSAMLVYLRYDEKRETFSYALASGFFVLALLTKTVTATLPGALLVIFWWQRGRLSWRRDIEPLLPWFAVGMAGGLLTAWVERTLIGAEGAPFEMTLLQRCLLAGRVIWFYLDKLFWPVDLMFIYPRWRVDSAMWWQYLFPLGVTALLLGAWFIRRRWRGPLAGLLLFIGSLFPVLGFLNVFPFIFSFVADHFQYLASLGIIVWVSAAMALGLARMPGRFQWIGQGLCMVLLGVLAVLSWQQSRMYRDPQTLYRATLERNPGCWMCRNNLGILLSDAGQRWEAIEQFQAALRIKPDDHIAHYNLGNVFFNAGLSSLAISQYQQALKLKPKFALAHLNLGTVLLHADRLSAAADQFMQAVRLKPNYFEAHYRLANTLVLMGKLSEAKEQYETVLRINPYDTRARDKLYVVHVQMEEAKSKN